jgi:hypothetical protein
MVMRPIIAIFCLSWFLVPLQAVPLPARSATIHPETIAAYEKIRAAYGGFDVAIHAGVHFRAGKEAAAKGLPGFRFDSLPDGKVPELPSVQLHAGNGRLPEAIEGPQEPYHG